MREVKRGRTGKHDILDDAGPEDTSGVWMLSYIDVMTLLVALFALLLAVAAANSADAPNQQIPDGPLAEQVSPGAIVVALGIGNGAPALVSDDAPRVQAEGALMLAGAIQAWQQNAVDGMAAAQSGRQVATREPLALAEHLPSPVKQIDPSGALALQPPSSAVAAVTALPPVMLDQRLNLAALGDMKVVITPAAPANTARLSPEAVASARDLSEAIDSQLADAKVLPSLEGVEVSSVSEGINLRIQDRLVFESAAADLTEIGEDVVNRLVNIIQRYDGTVSVEGHTDSRDIDTERFPSNWELSAARATAILRQLQAAGVDAKRLRAIGYGDTRPLESNDTSEGRSANRRVEVIVHL
ncbi:chemotaxis protein MotB [Onishia taeanensis]|uniref:Chemotaxis protein MotB n=1 Tax=Onishia taeanensis TaxID=284577 RepID=A0A1G7RCN5_9GAMM|nr:OmpA family protein [Halomonas taeanensis]SDG08566.1 chemotaxis protein MotB [Halomonas taeanensis]